MMTELIKIGIVFILLLLLTFKRVNLWICLFASTVLLGLLFHLSIGRIALDILSAGLYKDTLLLMGALTAILIFSNLMKETGRMDEILEGFRHIFKDIRVVIAMLPAMIGLLPIIGGALVSAPMVVAGSDELKLSAERRTFINYWFRHIWEYTLPTYPAFILAATVTGISVRRFSWINLPLTPAAILGGIIAFWGVSKSLKEPDPSSRAASLGRLFQNLSPLLLALILVIGLKVELAYALGVAIGGMILLFRIGGEKVFKGLRSSLDIELLLTVVAIMGFKKVLETSQVITSISGFLSASGIPVLCTVMVFPFMIGFMTGYAIATIGIALPVLAPFLKDHPQFVGYMALGFTSGFCGMMLSPFHLCLVLTKNYFGANWKGIYQLAVLPTAFILLVRLLMTLFL
jgi:integral membrane protein (TIGR00529 family)